MTRVLTLRIQPELLAKAEARAAQLGLDRGKYVRELIAQDVSQSGGGSRRKFASDDFIGSVAIGGGPYTNRRVRAAVQMRLRGKREKNR